ncbi:MAG TPA: DUF5819 family protein [Actinospica sp.]|jgi:hypothetical protein|nr:DUF5819 family protein [Actinospica sp.]
MPETVELSRRSKAVLYLAAALIALVTVTQLAAMTLFSSPSNTLSQQAAPALNWWIQPWLKQNWKLFGPNPQSANQTISARVRTAAGTESDWVDLTAIDYAAVRHDPMPSHENENELRLAWDSYAQAVPGSPLSDELRRYLVNFVVQRLGIEDPGPYTAVQLQVTNTPMVATGALAPQPSTQTLPWWPLTGQDGAGL